MSEGHPYYLCILRDFFRDYHFVLFLGFLCTYLTPIYVTHR